MLLLERRKFKKRCTKTNAEQIEEIKDQIVCGKQLRTGGKVFSSKRKHFRSDQKNSI